MIGQYERNRRRASGNTMLRTKSVRGDEDLMLFGEVSRGYAGEGWVLLLLLLFWR